MTRYVFEPPTGRVNVGWVVNPKSGGASGCIFRGGVIVAALSRSTKTIFGFLKLDNELLKVTKFGNSRYLFPWKIAD